jgi:prepilin-type N-terminal cleavage/methylation domain-containing protein
LDCEAARGAEDEAMRYRELRKNKRESFTLIELLVVMAIIAVLASLLLAAVMRVLSKKPEVATATELQQMGGGLQQFQQKTGATWIPSQLHMCQNMKSYNLAMNANNTPVNQLDYDSYTFITNFIGKNSNTFKAKWSSTGIYWVSTMPAGADEVLEGEQVLVFLLGGIQTVSGTQYNCIGFNPDVTNPDVAATPGQAIGPYFAFISSRLSLPPNGKYFAAYQDAYGARVGGKVNYYAFFTCYKSSNGYNRYGTSDCASLGVWPYASSAATPQSKLPTYVNSDTWQIICSGTDGNFGAGTDPTSATPYYWNPSTYGAIPLAGQDDQANFAFGKLQFGK